MTALRRAARRRLGRRCPLAERSAQPLARSPRRRETIECALEDHCALELGHGRESGEG